MSVINISERRNKITELLKPELSVSRAKARVLHEEIANKIEILRQTYSSIEVGKKTASWTVVLTLIIYFQNNEETIQVIRDNTFNCELYVRDSKNNYDK